MAINPATATYGTADLLRCAAVQDVDVSTAPPGETSGKALVVVSAALPASLGSQSPGSSLSVVPAGLEYEAVAASVTDQPLGATGAVGDFLSHIVIQPAAAVAGTCTVKDGTTIIFTFTTGTLGDLKPITVPFNAVSVNAGGWKVTTGASVAILAFGNFT